MSKKNIEQRNTSKFGKKYSHTGNKPLVESLERLEPEDIALREIIEGKISYQPFDEEEEG